tara:strand:+ start:1004 stop:1492 length:489 start_codon:yes stop_codon:yes gene_type:complete
MWVVAKIKSDQCFIFKQELRSKFGDQVEYYEPKIYHQKKSFDNEKKILGNYIFCFHEKFKDNKYLIESRYTKGLKYFLNGCKNSQKEIVDFINFCKKNQNHRGHLTQSFFQHINLKKAQFINGPLANIVFEIVSNQKKYLNVILGKRKIKIEKNLNFIYLPA